MYSVCVLSFTPSLFTPGTLHIYHLQYHLYIHLSPPTHTPSYFYLITSPTYPSHPSFVSNISPLTCTHIYSRLDPYPLSPPTHVSTSPPPHIFSYLFLVSPLISPHPPTAALKPLPIPSFSHSCILVFSFTATTQGDPGHRIGSTR